MTGDGLASRRAVVEILQAIMRRHQSFETAFAPRVRGLSAQDRAFVQRLVMTALRHHTAIRQLAESRKEKPFPPKFEDADWLLMLGITQLLADVPPHAAVNTTLELADGMRLAPVKGVINAILRGILRDAPEGGIQLPDEPALPLWWRHRWIEAYGQDTSRAMQRACLYPPPLDLTVKTGLPETVPPGMPLAPWHLRLKDPGMVENLPGYAEGGWWVQDISASLPVRLLGDVAGKYVLDVCAAPGGKTAQLADAGAKVTALDRSAKRLERLKENMRRLDMTVECVTADALAWKPDHLFDAVLLDAPCTATGTLRRHPDMPFLHSEKDIAELAALQTQLLQRCWPWVQPGGMLVYATCSLEREEGERQAAQFLREHPDARLQPVAPAELPGIFAECISREGYLRCLPIHLAEYGGMDGFFAARFVKQAS